MRGSCSWWQCLSVVSGVRGRVWRVDCSDSVIWTVGAGSSPRSHTPHSCTPISLNLLITNDTNNSFKNYFCGLIHHWWLELFKRWWTKVIEYFIVLSITKNNNDCAKYFMMFDRKVVADGEVDETRMISIRVTKQWVQVTNYAKLWWIGHKNYWLHYNFPSLCRVVWKCKLFKQRNPFVTLLQTFILNFNSLL